MLPDKLAWGLRAPAYLHGEKEVEVRAGTAGTHTRIAAPARSAK